MSQDLLYLRLEVGARDLILVLEEVAPPQVLELLPHQLDGIQVAAASWGIENCYSPPIEHSLKLFCVMAAEIVHHQQGVVGPHDARDQLLPEEFHDVLGLGAICGVPDQFVLRRAEGAIDCNVPSVGTELAHDGQLWLLPDAAAPVPDAGARLVEVDDLVALVDVADQLADESSALTLSQLRRAVYACKLVASDSVLDSMVDVELPKAARSD